MKLEIKSRWSGAVQFTAEIECDEGSPIGIKIGLAVRLAYKAGAVLCGADLRGADLRGAVLRGADLCDADLCDADLRGADLRGADLRGADLCDADLRDADLRGAVLCGADLRGADLRDADLCDADLCDADLRGADLRGAVLRGADLCDADLCDADLRGADLRDADLRDAPVVPDIHKAVYAAASAPGALDMGAWHTETQCGTAHCRAGWVVTLAGDAGKSLEHRIGTPEAAALIYMASDPKIEKIPDFYCSNEAALADMKRLAEQPLSTQEG